MHTFKYDETQQSLVTGRVDYINKAHFAVIAAATFLLIVGVALFVGSTTFNEIFHIANYTGNITTFTQFAAPVNDTEFLSLQAAPNITVSVSVAKASKVPKNIQVYVPIVVGNKKNESTPAPFQQTITVNSLAYSPYEASNLDNVEFFYSNGTIVPSWLELGNSNYTKTLYWLKIGGGIGANSMLDVYMGFAARNISLFNSTQTGEAPLLSPTYGEYDDGHSVFTFYDNFASKTIDSDWYWSGSVSENDSISINSSNETNSYIYSVQNYSAEDDIFELYGIFAPSPASNSISFGFNYREQSAPTKNSLYWKGVSNIFESITATTSSKVFSPQVFTSGKNMFGVYSTYNRAESYFSPLGSETSPTNHYSGSSDIFQGSDPLTVFNQRMSGSNITVYFVRLRAYPPYGAMPSTSFGKPVSIAGVVLSLENSNVVYGNNDTIVASTAPNDFVELEVNGNIVAGPSQSSVEYSFPVSAAGSYTIKALDTNDLKSAQQTLNVNKAKPQIHMSVLQSYNYNGAPGKFNVSVGSLDNQVTTGKVYSNGILLGNVGPSPVQISLGPNIAIHRIVVNTTATANYLSANATNIFAIYSNTISSIPTNVIKHVIIIFQENHAFDNYFSTYPGVIGAPANACEPYNLTNSSKGCATPHLDTNPVDLGAAHTWGASHTAYNNGSMNGFVVAANDHTDVMGYYTNETIPYYWEDAGHYTLTDKLFSSVLSYSLPNHWYEIAGQAPNASLYYGTCGVGVTGPINITTSDWLYCDHVVTEKGNEYLSEAQSIRTVADLLQAANISWDYYGAENTYPGNGLPVPFTYNNAVETGSAFNYWNPLLSQNRTYTAQYAPHIKNTGQIFYAIDNGTLANISWISPPVDLSEHPPANIIIGMWYTTDIVDSVMNSKYWNSTVIIIMWDDYGGYYDNVVPPQVDSNGLSFRVPGLIISPYAKENYIDNTQYSFESTMKMIEEMYGFAPLTNRDRNASDMLNAFNFNQSPQPPQEIPLNATQVALIDDYLGINATQLNGITNQTALARAAAMYAPYANDTIAIGDSNLFNETNQSLPVIAGSLSNTTDNDNDSDVNGTDTVNGYKLPASWFLT